MGFLEGVRFLNINKFMQFVVAQHLCRLLFKPKDISKVGTENSGLNSDFFRFYKFVRGQKH